MNNKSRILLYFFCLLTLSCVKNSGPEQKPDPFLRLAYSEKRLSCTTNTLSLNVESNDSWTISNSADWIEITPNMSQYNQTIQLILKISENKSTSERTSVIQFYYGKDKGASLSITQDGFQPLIEVSVSSISFGYRAAEKNIGISSNCGWYARSDANWIAIRPSTGLVGILEMNVLTYTNSSDVARTAHIHFFNDEYGMDEVISITQAAKPSGVDKHYIDEYGIDWGDGTSIHGLTWAPVNCGYKQYQYTYGKLFQWGRKWGLGYQDACFQDLTGIATAPMWKGENGEEDAGTFYLPGDDSVYGYDWIAKGSNLFWNQGTEEYPVKNTTWDPCPDGWRIPTSFEIKTLLEQATSIIFETIDEQNGYTFSDEQENKVFLPAGGRLNTTDGTPYDRGIEGYYWTCSTLYGNPAYLFFSSNGYALNKQGSRAGACLVRCVKE